MCVVLCCAVQRCYLTEMCSLYPLAPSMESGLWFGGWDGPGAGPGARTGMGDGRIGAKGLFIIVRTGREEGRVELGANRMRRGAGVGDLVGWLSCRRRKLTASNQKKQLSEFGICAWNCGRLGVWR